VAFFFRGCSRAIYPYEQFIPPIACTVKSNICTVIFILTWELNCYGRRTMDGDDDDDDDDDDNDDRQHLLNLSYSMKMVWS